MIDNEKSSESEDEAEEEEEVAEVHVDRHQDQDFGQRSDQGMDAEDFGEYEQVEANPQPEQLAFEADDVDASDNNDDDDVAEVRVGNILYSFDSDRNDLTDFNRLMSGCKELHAQIDEYQDWKMQFNNYFKRKASLHVPRDEEQVQELAESI